MIMELPEHIVMDILSWLPLKTIISYRCICKAWRNFLVSPYFARIHFSRAPTQILGMRHGYDNYVFIGEVDESLLLSRGTCSNKEDIHAGRKFTSIIKTFPSSGKSSVHNVVNGFVCLANTGWDPCRIHNPITGEVIVVHQTERRDSCRPIEFGLGFSRKTNELKLLRFVGSESSYILDGLDRTEADIYRLNTNSWRSIGNAPSGIYDLDGPFVNGALHSWKNEIGNSIFSLDFEEEEFRTVLAPPLKEGRDYEFGALEVLEGCLCMSYRKRSRCALDIWVMNEYGVKDSWTKRYVIDNVIDALDYRPYRLMKDGEILVVCDGKYLISYDPKRRSSRYITFRGSYRNYHHRIVPFVPNFLKVQTKDQVEGTKC